MTKLTNQISHLVDCVNVSQLARVSKVSRAQLNRILSGECVPNLETAEIILNVLGYELVMQKKDRIDEDNQS